MKITAQRSTIPLLPIRLLIAASIGLFLVAYVSATALAIPQDESKPWTSIKLLSESLDQLSAHPIAADWANETQQRLNNVVAGDQTDDLRIARIKQLAQHHSTISDLYQEVAQSSLSDSEREQVSTLLQQLNYQLIRRLATWSAIANLSNGNTPTQPSQAKDIDLNRVDSTWASYLLLDELEAAFATPADDEKAKRLAARRTLARIFSPSLKPAQATYVQSVFSTEEIQFLKSLARRPVDPSKIASRLELYEAQSGARSGHLLNDVHQDLLWSDDPDHQQAAQAINTYYRNANFRLTISQAFMNRLLPQLPTIAEPVSETVQGARVSGSSQVSNELNVALIQDDQRLNFEIQTNGHVRSDTVAKTKAFRIMNQGLANFQVLKQISVSTNGIDASRRAYATTTAKQFLVGVQSKIDNVPIFGKIARRAAEKKVREQSNETNLMFRKKVAQSAEARVEEEIAKQVEVVRQAANQKLLDPLVALDLEPTPLQLATTPSEIVVRYRLAGRDQMAANSARPISSDQSMIGIQLHHSLVNNAIARLGLNGETFTGQELAAHLQNVLGIAPNDDADKEQKEALFKFAAHDPIRLDFADDRVKIIINLDSLKIGKSGKSIRRLSITAAYTIQADGMRVNLVQDDTGTRVTSRGKRLRLGDRALISTVMQMLFEPSYSLNALPQQFRERPQAQSLAISRLVIHDGWLGVELNDIVLAEHQPTPEGKPEPRIGENIRRFFDRERR